MSDTNKTIYVLEERWFGNWRWVCENEDLEFLIAHSEDLKERIGKYGKIQLRIRDKAVKEND